MRIKYQIRGSPGTTELWKNIKPGTKVIIYEGWNVDRFKVYYGKTGIVTKNDTPRYSFDFCFHVKYSDGEEACIYPFDRDSRVVRGIILK